VRSNVRAGDNGRTPGPGWRKFTAYRYTEPGALPLALRLSWVRCKVLLHSLQFVKLPSSNQLRTVAGIFVALPWCAMFTVVEDELPSVGVTSTT
jgi:hypothetical protein